MGTTDPEQRRQSRHDPHDHHLSSTDVRPGARRTGDREPPSRLRRRDARAHGVRRRPHRHRRRDPHLHQGPRRLDRPRRRHPCPRRSPPTARTPLPTAPRPSRTPVSWWRLTARTWSGLTQSGRVLTTLDPKPLPTSVGISIDGNPVDAAISPDGARIAYTFTKYLTPSGASSGYRSATGYTAADRLTDPAPLRTTYFWSPSWVGNARTLQSGGYGSQVQLQDLGCRTAALVRRRRHLRPVDGPGQRHALARRQESRCRPWLRGGQLDPLVRRRRRRPVGPAARRPGAAVPDRPGRRASPTPPGRRTATRSPGRSPTASGHGRAPATAPSSPR